MEMGRGRQPAGAGLMRILKAQNPMPPQQEPYDIPQGNTNASNRQHHAEPYWKRAHRDWRMWVLVILMIGCMGIYLLTGDLRWPFFGPRQPMVPIAH